MVWSWWPFGLSGDEANCHSAETWAEGCWRCWDDAGIFGLIGLFEFPCGSVSKPCTPGEHQNSWYMDVHPPKMILIGIDPYPCPFRWCGGIPRRWCSSSAKFWATHCWVGGALDASYVMMVMTSHACKIQAFSWEPSWWHLQLLYLPHLVPWIAGEELHEVGCWLLVSISCSGTSNRSGPWLPRYQRGGAALISSIFRVAALISSIFPSTCEPRWFGARWMRSCRWSSISRWRRSFVGALHCTMLYGECCRLLLVLLSGLNCHFLGFLKLAVCACLCAILSSRPGVAVWCLQALRRARKSMTAMMSWFIATRFGEWNMNSRSLRWSQHSIRWTTD